MQPQLSESWPEKTKKKKKIFFFSQEEKGSFDPKWDPGAECRSPCVQFLAVMNCHAWKTRPNLGLQKQFGMMEGELEVNELGGGGGWRVQKQGRKWLRTIVVIWIHFAAAMQGQLGGSRAERTAHFRSPGAITD